MGGAKLCRFALFPLMLFMLLLLPAGMVAQKAASSSKYIATYESSTQTLTFKNFVGETLPSNIVVVKDKMTVADIKRNFENGTIVHIVFDKSFSTYTPTSLYKFFANLPKLKTITGLEYLNTEKVTNMSYMFYSCSSLTSLDVTHFNTAKVTNMNRLFSYCSSLTSLDVTHFNTAKVTNMNNMFSNCSSLTSLDVTYFNTANVTDMNKMFYKCSALTTIYASDNFVTDKVEYSYNMFYDCTSLKGTTLEYVASKTDHNYANCGTDGYFTSGCGYAEYDNATGTLTFRYKGVKPEGAYGLNEGTSDPGWIEKSSKINKVVFDASFANARPTSCYEWFYQCQKLTDIEGIENLNTEKVTDMSWMFSKCEKLSSLDLSNFNTEKVTNMYGMFFKCEKLTSLDLSNFNTEKVTNMGSMFCNCSSLTSLDLSNFNTAKVKNMYSMFASCSALTTIYASDKFVTYQVSNGEFMFYGCEKLKGYAESKTDKTYANYKTGYFSKLVGKNGDEKIGAAGETLATDNLVLDDGKDFVAYETFAAKKASYSRTIPSGSKWGTLCVPFAIDQSKETECKFYRLTGIDNDNDCITLESYEEGAKIPAGTPVLFKMNKGVQKLEISAQDAGIVKEPVAGTNTDVNLVGSFTKIGGKDNQGLAGTDYIIGKDKFWRVSDLNDGKGVGIKPMRAYIHPATASQARAAMLSIGKGDGTTAIDNLNAISNDANAEYYDANGRRTNGLQKGLNIVKRGSKTYKIMVK